MLYFQRYEIYLFAGKQYVDYAKVANLLIAEHIYCLPVSAFKRLQFEVRQCNGMGSESPTTLHRGHIAVTPRSHRGHLGAPVRYNTKRAL